MANVIAPNGSTVAMLCPGCGRGWAIAVQESEEKGGITDADVLACQYVDCNRHYAAPDFGLAVTSEDPGPIDETTPDFDPENPQPDWTPDPKPAQWDEVDRVRGLQLTGTDWIMNPPSDTPQEVIDQIAAYQQAWTNWRQALRDLPGDRESDPTLIVWPWPPPPEPARATATIPPPPDFVQWGEAVTTSYPYGFATNNAPPPGAQQIRINQTDAAQANAVYVDGTTSEGTDVKAQLAATVPGSTVAVRSSANPDAYAVFTVGAVIDQGTWVEFGVTPVDVGVRIQSGACVLEVSA